jgi:hypothetical protein
VREFVTQTGEKLVVLGERLLPLKPEMNLEQKIVLHFRARSTIIMIAAINFVLTR